MKKIASMIIFGVCLLCVSCSSLSTEIQGDDPNLQVTDQNEIIEITPSLIIEVIKATDTPDVERVEIVYSNPDVIMYDFVENLCAARWTNNGQELECPGDTANGAAGVATTLNTAFNDKGLLIEAPMILMIPAHGAGYGGIFGNYPPYYVLPGDHFRAVIAYQKSDNDHNIEHELYFSDCSGKLRLQPQLDLPIYETDNATADKGYRIIDYPLDALVNKWVRFMLVIQNNNGTEYDEPALWINPHIWRDPDAVAGMSQPPMTSVPDEAVVTPTNDETPGVISGMVDLSSAPPYLNDPGLGGKGMPVVVMFFNQDDGTWWWIHTMATHPDYQMTVPPGRYQVVAYAEGVGDVPYVSGGYTGSNPSCGNALKIVEVKPNQRVDSVDIADWNWSCSGDAYRPAKPGEVPLP